MFIPRNKIQLLFLGAIFGAVLYGAFLLAHLVETNETTTTILQDLGFFGALLIGILGGLNFVVPLPPAIFTPVFAAAGFSIPILILAFAIGTTIADLLGYLFGHYTKRLVQEKYPEIHAKLQVLVNKPTYLLYGFVFVYAAFVPLPNEAFIIPLAIIGVPLKRFIVPMLLGTLIYHTTVAYGVTGLFSLTV